MLGSKHVDGRQRHVNIEHVVTSKVIVGILVVKAVGSRIAVKNIRSIISIATLYRGIDLARRGIVRARVTTILLMIIVDGRGFRSKSWYSEKVGAFWSCWQSVLWVMRTWRKSSMA